MMRKNQNILKCKNKDWARPNLSMARASTYSILDAAYLSKIATCESQVKQMLMHSVQKKLSKQAYQLEIESTHMMSHIF